MNNNSDQWVDVIARDDMEPGDVTPVVCNGVSLAVYDLGDAVSVSSARCTHAGANLCDGYFDGKAIECPLHQGLFDARSGAALAAPVVRALTMYEARLTDGMVQIRFPIYKA